MIFLTNRKGESNNNPTLSDIQKALTELLIGKDIENVKENYVTLTNDSDLSIEIYQNSIVLQDYGSSPYDGPGGPGELLLVRVKEGSLFDRIEEAVELLEGEDREQLIELLKSLPKPE